MWRIVSSELPSNAFWMPPEAWEKRDSSGQTSSTWSRKQWPVPSSSIVSSRSSAEEIASRPPLAVQSIKHGLRKALDRADLVTTSPAGYCLHVEPDELDADRFARKVEEGGAALAAGRPERAGTILRDALALWYDRYPATRGLVREGSAEPE